MMRMRSKGVVVVGAGAVAAVVAVAGWPVVALVVAPALAVAGWPVVAGWVAVDSARRLNV